MDSLHSLSKNEDGFVLITAMVMLVILTLIGTFALNTTIFELQISGNDKVAKETFYKADGGLEAGIELTEQNISCPGGFTANRSLLDGTQSTVIGGIEVVDPLFWSQGTEPSNTLSDYPSDDYWVAGVDSSTKNRYRDVTFPPRDATANPPESSGSYTNLAIFGDPELTTGGAIQIAAGYEGKGKGAAGGGAQIVYNIHSQHVGLVNSESILRLQWRHLVGYEGDCIY